MQANEDAVHGGHGRPEQRLAAGSGGRRPGIGNHVEGKEDEGYAGHGREGGHEGRPRQEVADNGLQGKRAHPAEDEGHAAREA